MKKEGFTFIELMISIVILYFGLCVILNSFIGAIRALNAGQNYIESASFARKRSRKWKSPLMRIRFGP